MVRYKGFVGLVVTTWSLRSDLGSSQTAPRRRSYAEPILLVSILALAAFFRFYRIGEVPPGMENDEAFNLLDLLQLLQGQFSIFFAANNGREPLFFYLSTVGVALLGPQVLALRLTAAVVGLATIPLVYGFARWLFRSIAVAALAGLFASISVWHLFYSRFGLRVILSVPLTLLALWWFLRALKTQRSRDYAWAGAGTALSLYTYLSGRLVVVILLLLAATAILADRGRARDYIKGLLITAGVALFIFAPLGLYFIQHPDDFVGHSANLSILDPQVNHGNLAAALWNNAQSVAGVFLIRGDDSAARNIPGRPIFDPFLGVLFLVGLVLLLASLVSRRSSLDERLRAVMLAASLVVFCASSVLSDDAPSSLRTLPALPAAMMLAAWGAQAVWERLRAVGARHVGTALVGLVLLASALLSYRDYFLDFGSSGVTYYAFEAHLGDTARWINTNAPANRIFLAPLWYVRGAMQLLTRGTPLQSFESRDTVVLPSAAQGKDALFLFPPEQEQKAKTLADRLGGLGTRQDLMGKFGEKLVLVYRVPSANLPDARDPLQALARGGDWIQPRQTVHAVWDGQIELLGTTVQPEGPGGRNLTVTLFLRSLKPIAGDYSFSIKARDDRGRLWGQDDKWAGDNSYATGQWGVGDLVIEKFYPGLSACAPAGDYHVTVEVYDPRTMRALSLTGGDGTSFPLGTLHADESQGNRLEHLEPEEGREVAVGPDLRLMGWTLTPRVLRAGASFSLSLFWRGLGDGTRVRPAQVRLRDASGRDFDLAERNIRLPDKDRGLCTLFDLQAPAGLAAGRGRVLINDIETAAFDVER
jgi:4-amino-4-deoxy-L-arabinose transferase-like glycosyltransferase